MLQGNSLLVDTNSEAPEPSQMSGIFFWLTYLRMATLEAVPMVWNRMATCSSSMPEFSSPLK